MHFSVRVDINIFLERRSFLLSPSRGLLASGQARYYAYILIKSQGVMRGLQSLELRLNGVSFTKDELTWAVQSIAHT